MQCCMAMISSGFAATRSIQQRRLTPAVSPPQARRSAAVVPRAAQRPADFDGALEYVANKWEAVENKAVVGGYLAGAVLAVVVAEWLIHLPLFDILLGFPVQFVGLLTVVNLGLKRFVEKQGDLWDDAEAVVDAVAKQLPGLDK